MVFNRFWRADPARARTTGGTGLGLSIALEDAHLHGGWLQAWGEPGDGCQFRLTLPRRLGAELRGVADPARADGLTGAGASGVRRRSPTAGSAPRAASMSELPMARRGRRRTVRLLLPLLVVSARRLRLDPDLRPGQGRRRPHGCSGSRTSCRSSGSPRPRAPARRTSCAASCSPAPTSRATTRSPGCTSHREPGSGGARRPARVVRPTGSLRWTVSRRVTVTVEGTEVGRIDSEGTFRRSPSGTTVTRAFGMERVDGEWRIAKLDDGLMLSAADVAETYRQVSLYFLAPSGSTLVPDTVLLPELPGLTTKLVARLLRGPTAATARRGGHSVPPGHRSGGRVGAGPRRHRDRAPQRRGPAGRRQRPGADVGADRLDAQAAVRGAPGADHRGR